MNSIPRVKILKKLLLPTRLALADAVDRRVRLWCADQEPYVLCLPRAIVLRFALAELAGCDHVTFEVGAAMAMTDDGHAVGWSPARGGAEGYENDHHVWLVMNRCGASPTIIDPSARYFAEVSVQNGFCWSRSVPRILWAPREQLVQDGYFYTPHQALTNSLNRNGSSDFAKARRVANKVIDDLRRHGPA